MVTAQTAPWAKARLSRWETGVGYSQALPFLLRCMIPTEAFASEAAVHHTMRVSENGVAS